MMYQWKQKMKWKEFQTVTYVDDKENNVVLAVLAFKF